MHDLSSTGINVGESRRPLSDSHGLAAMLLVESVLHELIARAVIDVQAAIGVVRIAADVADILIEEDVYPRALVLGTRNHLEMIIETLGHDLSEDVPEPE